MVKKIHYRVLISLGVFGIFFATFLFIFHSNKVLNYAYSSLNKLTDNAMSVQKIEGSLAGPIEVNSFFYQRGQTKISVAKLHVNWKLSDLLLGKLKIEKLFAEDIRIQLPSQPKAKSGKIKIIISVPPLVKLLLPHHFVLRNIELNEIKILAADSKKRSVIDKINLTLIASNKGISFIDFNLQAKNEFITLKGQLRGIIDFNWLAKVANLNNIWPMLNGSINTQGKIQGNKENLIANAKIKVNDFSYKNFAVKAMQSSIDIDSATKKTELHFNFSNIQVAKYNVAKLNINGALIVNRLFSNPDIYLKLKCLPFSISILDKNSRLDFQESNLESHLTKAGLSNKFSLVLDKTAPINGDVTINKDHSIIGTIKWYISDISWIRQLVPKVSNVKGNLDMILNLSGKLSAPKWQGQVKLQNLSFDLMEPNLALQNGKLFVDVNPAEISYKGSIAIDQSVLNLNGKTDIIDKFSTKINLSGNNLLISNTPTLQLYVSPDLQLSWLDNRFRMDGTILVPKAIIQDQAEFGVESLPSDTVFAGEKKESIALENFFASRINLILGKDVSIDFMGFKGNMTGRLTLSTEPKQPTFADGTLIIENGSYKVYGQKLSIEQGRLNFQHSAVANPSINIRAIRKIKIEGTSGLFDLENRNVTVGVLMLGQLNNPQVSLFSEPGVLAQEDILSYLILGQSTNTIGKDQAGLLVNAAQTLNVSGVSKFTHLTDNLKDKFGLSELGLESRAVSDVDVRSRKSGFTTTTSLMLGKFLTPSLYVGYSIGLLDQVSIIKVRYYLGKKITLQTESSSTGTGVDILYSISRP